MKAPGVPPSRDCFSTILASAQARSTSRSAEGLIIAVIGLVLVALGFLPLVIDWDSNFEATTRSLTAGGAIGWLLSGLAMTAGVAGLTSGARDRGAPWPIRAAAILGGALVALAAAFLLLSSVAFHAGR